MQRRESTFDARCCKCGANIPVGAEMFYQAAAPRGQRSYCTSCGTSDSVVVDPAAELAELKRKLATMDSPKTPARPATATGDPLAAAIAAAVEPLLAGKLDEGRVREIIADHMKPAMHTITVKTPAIPEGINLGRQHKQFEELLIACSARIRGHRLNVWLVGPAGTGKTTAAEWIAKALGLKFAATGSLTETYKLFGFMSPGTGLYVRTLFREIWEHGGVFVLDDFDGSDPVAALEMNNALANGSCTFPDGVVARHSDCVIILTANTWGTGATNDYVGRVKQDAAFLDRFVHLDWQIDEELERDTCHQKAWVARVQSVRAKVAGKGIRVLVTPRATYFGAALLDAGMPLPKVEAMTLRKGMTADQWSSIC